MSRFKFGEIEVTVDRRGPPAEKPDVDEYAVRISGPEESAWIQSAIQVPRVPRTAAVDFSLAMGALSGLMRITDDPSLVDAVTRGEISDEEFRAVTEVAKRLEPYFPEAEEAINKRMDLYLGGHSVSTLGISRPLHLPGKIRTKKDIANFFAYLYREENLSFHPDEDFNGYVTWKTHEPVYTMEEAHERNRLMAEAFEVAAKEKLNIYEIGLWVGALLDVVGSDTEVADVPEWLQKLSDTWI